MGIHKIETALKQKQTEQKNIFVPYIMAGDGGLAILPEQIAFLEECGVAAIELGIPFSDPVADGPVIQDAGQRALENGTTLTGVLEVLKQTKEKRTVPIILMTYINPIFTYGVEQFALDCAEAGVDGLIIPDLPLEEEDLINKALQTHSLAFIRLAALTSPIERITELAKRAEGFLYAVAVRGTTGVQTAYDQDIQSYLQTLKENNHVPVLAGFGVSSPEQAQELSSYCDGVIVGSKIVQLLHEGKNEEVRQLIEGSL